MAVSRHGEPVELVVGDQSVRVTNPDRVYFPEAGVTKIELVRYYIAIADGLVRALHLRPTTLERWPGGVVEGAQLTQRDGAPGDAFYQKRVPKNAPSYVETARIMFPSGRTADEICVTEPAVVAWAANLGTITFHPWPVRRGDVDHPDELRIDLDPQPGTDFADAVTVATETHALLDELGWVGWPKTSGGRGVHVYVRLQPRWTFTEVRQAAIALARELERRRPDLVTTAWWKEQRGEKVFVDFNQNARDRTIASAYSARARAWAPVSTPLGWDELADAEPRDFTVRTVPERFARLGDRWAGIDETAHDLTPLLGWWERDLREHGLEDMPYPPDHPKMVGEPRRVQPSRAKKPR
ncbi:non-homologous end-joining DNA ligase [Parafrankia sp. FMc6]|uniref:non-homologous end-joining DNA ligase n=1 Tax=Parafrankia soli TaxID=2599596 RepID=UPI0034D729C5